MLRDDRKEPMPRPIPIPRKEPTYEMPKYDDFDYPNYDPEYDCPDFRYPMMPMYPNNMYPCPYPEKDMYGDRRIDLEDMMRRNPMLKRCVMECIERYGQSNNPCRPQNPCRPCKPSPMPKRRAKRPCYGLEEYDSYDNMSYENYGDYGSYESYESYNPYRDVLDETDIYEFSDAELEDFIEDLESEENITE